MAAPKGNHNHKKGSTLTPEQKKLISIRTKEAMAKLDKKVGRKKGYSHHYKGVVGVRSKESNEKQRIKMTGRITPVEVKNKIRKSSINYLKEVRSIPFPCIGRYEKQMLDNIEKSLGYNIIRQKQVAGFYLDGYCPALNLAIEIDEKHHIKREVEDMERDKLIQQELNCMVVRIPLRGD